jgi:hypothetical protein
MQQDEIKNFSQFLSLHADGSLNDELTKALNDMIGDLSNRVLDQGGKQKGKITLEIGVALDQGIIEIVASHKATMPKDATKSVYWATADNNLSQSNPKQTDMFRDVSGNREPARTA